MKKDGKRSIRSCLLGMIFVMVFMITGISSQAETKPKEVEILFLHDTHSHLESFSTLMDGKTETVGGFARIKSLIEAQTEKNPETLILDAGDFSMGTLVQTVFESEAAELRMLGSLGVAATTLGNHEFDYRSQGLANMLMTAKEKGEKLPELLVSNIDWDAMEKKGLTEEQQILKDAMEAYESKDYVILEKGGVTIAVFGLFGKDSLACAPTCVLEFQDPVKCAKNIVKEIQEKESADMIICLSHSGTNEDASKSEDEILAQKVPEIDLIISGHSHTTLEEPLVYGSTWIGSCGSYGINLGSLKMVQKEDGTWDMQSYEMLPVTTKIPEETETKKEIQGFMASVDEDYLSRFGYKRDQILAENQITFSTVEDLSNIHTEHNLGNLIADAYVYGVTHTDEFQGETVHVAIAPSGTIRDTYGKGNITVEQVFNSFSLGIGADGIPGYPLVKTYLTGEELKIIAEIDASISNYMTAARLYMSGMHFTYNPNRLILNKVTDCYLMIDGEKTEILDDQLYCVVSDLYSAQMLGAVTDLSYGLLSIEPKFQDGTKAENYEDLIIHTHGRELKAWETIAAYMESFPDTDGDGVSEIPETYGQDQGRKVVNNSKNLWELIKKPNKFTFMILGILLLLVIILIGLVILFVKLGKKIHRKIKEKKRNNPSKV